MTDNWEKILGYVVTMNIFLSAVHFALLKIHQRFAKLDWPNWALDVVEVLMKLISVSIANLPHPESKSEITGAPPPSHPRSVSKL